MKNEIRELKTEFLMYVDEFTSDMPDPLPEFQVIGDTPFGNKMVARDYGGGTFEGPKLKGTIVEGADWYTTLNGFGLVDWRGTFKTDDGAFIYCEMEGFIHSPVGVEEEPGAALGRFSSNGIPGKGCNHDEYYFRTAGKMYAGDPKYAWLNGLVCVAVGEYRPDGHMVYSIYAVI